MTGAPWYVWAMIAYQLINVGVVITMAANRESIRVTGGLALITAVIATTHILIYSALLEAC